MDLVEFKKHVSAFSKSDVLTIDQLKRNFQLGLLGEVGKFIDLFKKHLYQGDVLDLAKVKSKAGDILWDLYVLGKVYGQDFEIPDFGAAADKDEDSIAHNLLHLGVCSGEVVQNLAYEGDFPETLLRPFFWYLFSIISPFGITLGDCMAANVEKLTKRHGGNAFNPDVMRVNKPLESQPTPYGWDKV